MPRQRTRGQIINKLDELEPQMAQAFLDAVNTIRSRVRMQQLSDAIDRNDLAAAVRVAGIRSEAVWSQVTEATRTAFLVGGDDFAATAPARLGVDFSINSPRAERWLRENAAQKITLWTQETQDAIRDATSGAVRRGINPRKAALDIAGRVNRVTGRRQGGVIGLSRPQRAAVNKASEELRAATKQTLSSYLRRERRDKRFDRIVERAISSGERIPQSDITRMVGRYSDRLLQLRAETIARTETLNAFNAGSHEAVLQSVDDGFIKDAGNISRIWRTASDERVRGHHAAVNGTSVGLNEPFLVLGEKLMHPGDTMNGSPLNTVLCRCVVRHDVDWISEEL